MHKTVRTSTIVPGNRSNSTSEVFQSEIKTAGNTNSKFEIKKEVDIIIEKPIIKEIVVEVPYDVIIEKPVENRIERDVIVEKIVEVPVERIIEREVEEVEQIETLKIIEKPVYTEKTVDNIIEKIIEVPVEVQVNKEVEVIEEVEVNIERNIARPYRIENKMVNVTSSTPQVENIIVERRVEVPVNKYVDVEVEEIREVIKEVPREKIIYNEKFVDVPVEKVVVVEEEKEEIVKEVRDKHVYIEKPVYQDVIRKVQKPIKRTVQKIVDKEIIIPKQEVVEVRKFRDNIVNVETVVDIPKEKIVEVEKVVETHEEIERPQTITKEIINEHEVEAPIYRKVAKYVEVPYEKVVEKVVEKPVDIRIEKEITKVVKVDKIVPIEKIKEVYVEVPYETKVNKEYEVEVFKEVPVYVDKIIQKKVEKVIEKKVYVPFKKYIQVPIEKIVEKKIETEVITENPIYIENIQYEDNPIRKSATNERLRKSWSENQNKLKKLNQEKRDLQNKLYEAKSKKNLNKSDVLKEETFGLEENIKLRTELETMHKELSNIMENVQRSHLENEVNASIKQTSRAREINEQEMNDLVRESTLEPRIQESVSMMRPMENSFMVNTPNKILPDDESNFFRIEATPSGRMIKVPLNQDQRVSVKTNKKEVQSNFRKSQNRFYRLDDNGNKVYVNQQEQIDLEQKQRSPSQKRY